MSKVIHLSDQAHNNAKNFCKMHSLKMSDWVADLIIDAIVNNRVDPRVSPKPAPPPSPPQQVSSVAAPEVEAPVLITKKKLERIGENGQSSNDSAELPPWSAPPFWAKS